MRSLAGGLLLAVLALAGCASAGRAPAAGPPSPDEVAGLQARVRRDSADVTAQIALAEAYRRMHRLDDARALLDRAVARQPRNGRAVLLLGVTREESGDLAGARQLYERLLQAGAAPGLRRDLRSRLVLLQRQEVVAAVKDAVARETELRDSPPKPHTLAIFPLGVAGTDSTLRPLGRALTAMLVTDMSQTGRLTVLDRLAVQLLAEEVRLGRSGLVDARTAARGGRLLGAERVVDGSVVGRADEVRIEAAVVAMARAPAVPAAPTRGRSDRPSSATGNAQAAPAQDTRASAGSAAPSPVATTVSASDRLSNLFGVEKRIALDLYAAVGIQLTPAERAAVLQRRTGSLQALLAYGRGLIASDAGDFATAEREFAEAVRLDPGFALARQQLVRVRAVREAQGMSTARLAARAMAPSPPASALRSVALPLLPVLRNPTAEVLGTEGAAGSLTLIDLVIPRPGGN